MEINDQAREELWQTVNHLSDEDIAKKPADDCWSIGQILEHLALIEGGVTKTLQRQLINGEISVIKDKPISRAVDRSTKVEAPAFAVPADEPASLSTLKEKLDFTHEQLRVFAEQADEEQLAAKSYPHPSFGDMSLKQWIPFLGYHERRHIEQIKKVKEQLGLV